MIVACSVGLRLGVSVVPELFANLHENFQMLTSNGIVAGSLTAISVSHIMFNMMPSKKAQGKQYPVN